jgi:hypothetical protein
MKSIRKVLGLLAVMFVAAFYTQSASATCTTSSDYRMGTSWYGQVYGGVSASLICSIAVIYGDATAPIVETGTNSDVKPAFWPRELFAPLYYNPIYKDLVNCLKGRFQDLANYIGPLGELTQSWDYWNTGVAGCYIPNIGG